MWLYEITWIQRVIRYCQCIKNSWIINLKKNKLKMIQLRYVCLQNWTKSHFLNHRYTFNAFKLQTFYSVLFSQFLLSKFSVTLLAAFSFLLSSAHLCLSVTNCIFLIYFHFFGSKLVIAGTLANSFHPPQTPASAFVPGQVGFLGCPGGNIRWPGTPQ